MQTESYICIYTIVRYVRNFKPDPYAYMRNMRFASSITHLSVRDTICCAPTYAVAYDLRMDYSHTFVILYFIKNKIYAEYGKLKNKCLACHCMSTLS